MKLSKKKIAAIVAGLLLATAVIVIKNKKTALSEIPPMKAYALVVDTIKVQTKKEHLALPYLATIMSDKSVKLTSRVASRVTEIAKSGTEVKKGEIVVRLDDRDLQDKKYTIMLQSDSTKTELSAKKTALNNARATHQRTLKLLKVKGASIEMSQREESTIKGLEAAVKAEQNKIKILNTNLSEIETALSYSILKSPQKGRVSKTFANAGEMAMPGKALLDIEDEKGKYLLIRTADRAHAKICIFDKKSYAMRALNSTFNGLNEYRADIETDRASGERVDISLLTYNGSGIKVPFSALLQKDGKNFVFAVQGRQAKALEVKIIARGENAVIVDGLKEKQEIVLAKPDILLQLLAGKPISVNKH